MTEIPRRCECGHLESVHREPRLGYRICGPGSCPCAVFRDPFEKFRCD